LEKVENKIKHITVWWKNIKEIKAEIDKDRKQ
jgi:hypothetical protein